jgi:glucose dehydrogenase
MVMTLRPLRRFASRRNFLLASAGALALPAAPAAWRLLQRTPKESGSIAEYAGPTATLQELRTCAPLDVCVVGSGPAGTLLGIHLARAGVRTLIVEAGVNPSDMARDPRYALLNQGEVTGDLLYPLTASRMLTPGGTTALWTGNTPRLLPIDFERNAYTPPGADWPVSYAALEPYYCRAERTLGVSGDSEAPHSAPRNCSLPYETGRGANTALKRVLARAGVEGAQTFRSRSMQAGPIRVARDLLPVFARYSNALFASGIVARRFKTTGDGTVTAVELQDLAGERHELTARCFVLASGGIESARRLLLSRSEAFPNGLGNQSDLVGRTFSDHPTLQFVAQVPNVGHRPGDLPQILRCFQFYEPFKRQGLGSVYLAIGLRDTDPPGPHGLLNINVDVELWPATTNRVMLDDTVRDPLGDPALRLHLAASEQDRATFNAARSLVRDLALKAGANAVEEIPLKWSYHHLGTVRMGANPRTSVVDADLKVHGTRNLYAVTSGNFVTPGVSNPTLLIVALAHRLAPHLLASLRAGAFASVTEAVA